MLKFTAGEFIKDRDGKVGQVIEGGYFGEIMPKYRDEAVNEKELDEFSSHYMDVLDVLTEYVVAIRYIDGTLAIVVDPECDLSRIKVA